MECEITILKTLVGYSASFQIKLSTVMLNINFPVLAILRKGYTKVTQI